MPKGIPQVKVTLNNEKIKCIALTIVKLRWSEGIRQAVSQSLKIFIKIP